MACELANKRNIINLNNDKPAIKLFPNVHNPSKLIFPAPNWLILNAIGWHRRRIRREDT